jgi:hypothetical protein
MPSPEEIMRGLKEITNAWQFLAILWHVYFAILMLIVISGRRPPKRLAGLLLVIPFFSVSALAWMSANIFNGMFFALSGAALLFITIRLPRSRIQTAPFKAIALGVIMFVFGWIYPHFLKTESFIPYLYSAPTGLIPCPTLASVIGLSIILGSFGAHAWSAVLAITGVFYSLFGAIYLGVQLDWILLFGALSIVVFVHKDTDNNQSETAS